MYTQSMKSRTWKHIQFREGYRLQRVRFRLLITEGSVWRGFSVSYCEYFQGEEILSFRGWEETTKYPLTKVSFTASFILLLA